LTTNMLGTARTVEAFLGPMLKRGQGHIVGVGSLAGLRGLPKGAYYCASKAAQAVFLESLRFDVAPFGVKVSLVLPGFMDTPMNAPVKERYRMLPMMPVEKAARRLLLAVAKGRRTIVFPRRLSVLAVIDRFLPKWLSDRGIALLNRLVTRHEAAATAAVVEHAARSSAAKGKESQVA
jgi:short-subunit dehydrogenase